MPAGSIAPRMTGEPIMAPVTIHVTNRRLLKSKLTSSPNMPGILHRLHSPSGIRTYGLYQIPPLSFLHTSNLSDWSMSRKEIDGSALIVKNWGEAYHPTILHIAAKFYQLCLHSRSHKLEWAKSLIDLQWWFTCHKNGQAVQGPVPLWTRWCYIPRLHLMKCSPLVTLLLLPSRDSSCHWWHC